MDVSRLKSELLKPRYFLHLKWMSHGQNQKFLNFIVFTLEINVSFCKNVIKII